MPSSVELGRPEPQNIHPTIPGQIHRDISGVDIIFLFNHAVLRMKLLECSSQQSKNSFYLPRTLLRKIWKLYFLSQKLWKVSNTYTCLVCTTKLLICLFVCDLRKRDNYLKKNQVLSCSFQTKIFFMKREYYDFRVAINTLYYSAKFGKYIENILCIHIKREKNKIWFQIFLLPKSP
jgi:hypothetical protein